MSDPPDEDGWGVGPAPSPADYEPAFVVVIDTSSIVQLKQLVPIVDQWDFCARMLELVQAGRLTFPPQVHAEMTDLRYPDLPGAWCSRAKADLQFARPSDTTLATIAPFLTDLVEEDAEGDPADPYVIAMAYECLEAGYDVAVATNDCVDRLPRKIAMTTACDRLSITHWDTATFVTWVWESTPIEPPPEPKDYVPTIGV